jgi:hypothetical protein
MYSLKSICEKIVYYLKQNYKQNVNLKSKDYNKKNIRYFDIIEV